MSKVERKEYQETKIMRTLSPTRYGGSQQNVTEFDNSLDHLLEDLQSTVPRPGSSMANGSSKTYRESSRSTRGSSADHIRSSSMTRVKPSNPITEFSTDDSYSYTAPDGTKHIKTVKKESYSYKSGGSDMQPEKMRMQNNISQLDSLLDDLQQVKQSGYNNNNLAVEPGYQQYSKNKIITGKRIMEKDVPVQSYSERTRSTDRVDREGSINREIYQHNEGTYGDIKHIRTTSPSPSKSNTSTLSKQTRVTNVQAYPLEVVETTTPDINPEILASLDPELLPSGNTKVTTTIKTYTYEIPGSGGPVEPEKYVYSPNTSSTTPSKSFVYNKYENNSLTRNYQTENRYPPSSPENRYPSSQISPVSPPPDDRKIITETVTTRNYQPKDPNYHPQPGKQTYIYNENTSTRNYTDYPQQPRQQQPPQRNGETTYIIKETHHHTTNRDYSGNRDHPGNRDYPGNRDSPDRGHLPPVNTTIQRFDSLTNLNARQHPDAESFDPKHPPYPNQYPQHLYPQQQSPTSPEVNVTYKYKSSTNTTNNYRTQGGYPPEQYENAPLLPRKFPTDENGGPPKKLDDLMATIGREPPNSSYNAGWSAHEEEMAQQRKIDSLKAQSELESQKKEDKKEVARTKNVTGPPVYYPPGHEMFARKEEAGAWRAQGEMAREKGMYKYEAESSSKTKSSSGAAIVPVCLPLCCGLPCTII